MYPAFYQFFQNLIRQTIVSPLGGQEIVVKNGATGVKMGVGIGLKDVRRTLYAFVGKNRGATKD